MKTIDKTVNLSQTQAKSMFKKYATNIVKALRSKGIKMIKESEYANGVDCFSWQSYISEKKFENAKIYLNISHEKTSCQYITGNVHTHLAVSPRMGKWQYVWQKQLKKRG